MADSLFNDDDVDNVDYLKELTGPGGKFDRSKYQSDEDMYKAIAKGKYHGDKTLELQLQKNDQLREDFIKMKEAQLNMTDAATTEAKLQELLDRIENRRDPVNTDTGDKQPTFDLKKIEDIATQRAIQAVKELEATRQAESNLAAVESRLRERFGSTAKQVLRDQMTSLGLTAEDVQLLAKKSPELAINALGLNQQQQSQYNNPPSSNTRSDNFKPSTDVRDAVYYEKLRKENPKEYFSEKTSVQRLRDMDHPDFLKRYEAQNPRTFY
jgi:hypothetical protein